MRITSTHLNERNYTILKVLILELSSLYLERLLLIDVLMLIKTVKIIFTTQILFLIFHLVSFLIMMLLMNFYSLPENILLIQVQAKYLDNIFLRMIFLQIKINIFLVLLSLTILNVLISMPSSPLNKIKLKTFLSNLMKIIYLFKNLGNHLILLKNIRDRIYEYVYRTYDLDYIENIYILGDGANWIKGLSVIYSILLKLIMCLINSMLCKLYSVLLHTLI